jgi:hypothetical protein
MGKGNYNFLFVYVKHYVVSNQLTQLMCNLVFYRVIDKHLLQTTSKHWTQSYVFIKNKTLFDVFGSLMFCWSNFKVKLFFKNNVQLLLWHKSIDIMNFILNIDKTF